MRKAILYALLIVFAASGQTVEKTLLVSYAHASYDMQEIATAIRSVTDIRDIHVNPDHVSIALSGPAERVAAAEWIVNDLANVASAPGSWHEYRIPGTVDQPVMRVYNASYIQNPQELQQVITMIRAIADVQRIFQYYSAKAIVTRGDEDKLLLADWIVQTLRQPAGFVPTSYDFHGEVVRLRSLPGKSMRQMQEIVTRIRTEAGIPRIFMYGSNLAVAFRGTPEQIAAAERIVAE